MRRLNFGCGGFKIPGWENYDIEVDISKPLPFPDKCAEYIFAEHVIEHITHQEAWNFFEECYRIMIPGGQIRIAIPDICRLSSKINIDYCDVVKSGGWGDGSIKSAIKAMVFCHGHKAVWTFDMLKTYLETIGFKPNFYPEDPRISSNPDLSNLEQHWKTVGEGINYTETSIVEAYRDNKI